MPNFFFVKGAHALSLQIASIWLFLCTTSLVPYGKGECNKCLFNLVGVGMGEGGGSGGGRMDNVRLTKRAVSHYGLQRAKGAEVFFLEGLISLLFFFYNCSPEHCTSPDCDASILIPGQGRRRPLRAPPPPPPPF